MPFFSDDEIDDAIPHIASDLFNDLDGLSDENPLDSGPLDVQDTFVLRLDGQPNDDDLQENGLGDSEGDSGVDDDLPNALSADMDDHGPKKRGRPSLAAVIPKAKSPSKKAALKAGPKTTVAPVSRKRKDMPIEDAEHPARKRGRATAAAANRAMKEVSTKRPRAVNDSAKAATGAKRVPKTKLKKNEEVEYEVEKIMDSKRDGNTKSFQVKWKGFSKPTWEPEANLAHASEVVEKYEAAQASLPHRPASKAASAQPKKPAAKISAKKAATPAKQGRPAKKATATKAATASIKKAGRPAGRPKRH